MFGKKIKYIIVYNNYGTILEITGNLPVAQKLNQWHDNVFYENFFFNRFSLRLVNFLYKNNMITLLSYNQKTKRIMLTKKHLLSDEVADFSLLLRKKARFLSKLLRTVSNFRYKLYPDTLFQTLVYEKKVSEAKKFLDLPAQEEDPLLFPFLYQYAQREKISFKQAAEDIVLKSSFADDILLSSEAMRLEYLAKIKTAKTMDEVSQIEFSFTSDTGKTI